MKTNPPCLRKTAQETIYETGGRAVNEKAAGPNRSIQAAAGVAVLACLFALSRHNFLLFHGLVELFSIAVAWSVFLIVQPRRYTGPSRPLRNMVPGVKRARTGDIVWLLINGFAMRNGSGKVEKAIVTFADITERKRAEEGKGEPRRAAAPGPEDGSLRKARRRSRPRLQQHAGGDPGPRRFAPGRCRSGTAVRGEAKTTVGSMSLASRAGERHSRSTCPGTWPKRPARRRRGRSKRPRAATRPSCWWRTRRPF